MAALQEGQYVKHFRYGFGVITASNVERTSIDFDLHGIRKFVTSLLVVELSDKVPPKREPAKRRKKASTTLASVKSAARAK